MFDTNIVVIGNVLNTPEWRRTSNSGALVANFRVASTSRRIDRETGKWVDHHQLRVRVSCWRKLAEGVASSISVGDPVVVSGRLFTRDWTDSDGVARTTYEMDAITVGHDLSRGRARFYRNKNAATAAAELPEADDKVRGEAATVVPEGEEPVMYGDGVPESEEPSFDEAMAGLLPGQRATRSRAAAAPAPVTPALAGGGFEPFDTRLDPALATAAASSTGASEEPDGEPGPDQEKEETDDDLEPVEAPAPAHPDQVMTVVSPRRTRSRTPRRQPVAA